MDVSGVLSLPQHIHTHPDRGYSHWGYGMGETSQLLVACIFKESAILPLQCDPEYCCLQQPAKMAASGHSMSVDENTALICQGWCYQESQSGLHPSPHYNCNVSDQFASLQRKQMTSTILQKEQKLPFSKIALSYAFKTSELNKE